MSANTHAHARYQSKEGVWVGLPKKHGWDQQLRVYRYIPPRNTTADFMADQSKTHKQTCSVLRHVDKQRFLIVTHDLLM